MAKSTVLNFTQNLNNISLQFNSSDVFSVIQVAPTANGTNLTAGTRTFTSASSGTLVGGTTQATWTAAAVGTGTSASVAGPVTITSPGTYLPAAGPTNAANAATVDSGSSAATWALSVGILKTLYTSSTNDAVVKSITVASTDSAARIMSLWEQDAAGGPMNLIGSVSIPASSGSPTSGTAASIDLIGGNLIPSLPYDANGKRVLPLKVGTKLYAAIVATNSTTAAVTASTFISVHAMIEEY